MSHRTGFTADHSMRGCTPEERLWAKVEKTEGCWLWVGKTRDGRGYGRITVGGRPVGTHRLSYELHYGPIPEGLFVLHSCDVRTCVRPDHLRVGTAADNTADCVARDRVSRKPSRPKLTVEQVRMIRQRAASGEKKAALAREYGVLRDTVSKLVHRHTWSDVA